LECVRNVTGSEIVASAIAKTLVDVKEGKPLSETLADSGAFPEDLVEMLRVGEESGKVAVMLARAADVYDRQVRTVIKSFTKVLEPIMILVMGTVIGFVVMAMMLPIFQMNLMAK
jgi:type II secretory pathway component PulF